MMVVGCYPTGGRWALSSGQLCRGDGYFSPLWCPQWVRTHQVQRAKCQEGTPGCDSATFPGDRREGSLYGFIRGSGWACLALISGPAEISVSQRALAPLRASTPSPTPGHRTLASQCGWGSSEIGKSTETLFPFLSINSDPSPTLLKSRIGLVFPAAGSPAGNCAHPALAELCPRRCPSSLRMSQVVSMFQMGKLRLQEDEGVFPRPQGSADTPMPPPLPRQASGRWSSCAISIWSCLFSPK